MSSFRKVTVTIPKDLEAGNLLELPMRGADEPLKLRAPQQMGAGSTLILIQEEGTEEWNVEVGSVVPVLMEPEFAAQAEEPWVQDQILQREGQLEQQEQRRREDELFDVQSYQRLLEEQERQSQGFVRIQQQRIEIPTQNQLGQEPMPTATEAGGAVACTVRLDTTVGVIDIIVRPDWAPQGARRFLELVAAGDLDQLAFYRSIEGCIAQFGLPGKRRWEPIPDDPPSGVPFSLGAVSFAAVGENSRKSTIFICTGDMSHCLGQNAWEMPVGSVAESSLDVLHRIDCTYGDIAEFQGNGPDTARINAEGNTYLQAEFPRLTYIKKAWPLDWEPEIPQDVNSVPPLNEGPSQQQQQQQQQQLQQQRMLEEQQRQQQQQLQQQRMLEEQQRQQRLLDQQQREQQMLEQEQKEQREKEQREKEQREKEQREKEREQQVQQQLQEQQNQELQELREHAAKKQHLADMAIKAAQKASNQAAMATCLASSAFTVSEAQNAADAAAGAARAARKAMQAAQEAQDKAMPAQASKVTEAQNAADAAERAAQAAQQAMQAAQEAQDKASSARSRIQEGKASSAQNRIQGQPRPHSAGSLTLQQPQVQPQPQSQPQPQPQPQVQPQPQPQAQPQMGSLQIPTAAPQLSSPQMVLPQSAELSSQPPSSSQPWQCNVQGGSATDMYVSLTGGKSAPGNVTDSMPGSMASASITQAPQGFVGAANASGPSNFAGSSANSSGPSASKMYESLAQPRELATYAYAAMPGSQVSAPAPSAPGSQQIPTPTAAPGFQPITSQMQQTGGNPTFEVTSAPLSSMPAMSLQSNCTLSAPVAMPAVQAGLPQPQAGNNLGFSAAAPVSVPAGGSLKHSAGSAAAAYNSLTGASFTATPQWR